MSSDSDAAARPRLTPLLWALPALLLWTVAVVVAFDVARGVWAARAAARHASELGAHLRAADFSSARVDVRGIQRSVRSARRSIDGPLWNAAGDLPLLGHNVSAMQMSAKVVEEAADRALPVGVRLAEQVHAHDLRDDSGAFDLPALAGLRPTAAQLTASLQGPRRRAERIDTDGLLPLVRSRVGSLQDGLAAATSGSAALAVVSRVGPALLGGDGPRTYLLVVQNNAEIRATGGLPGSLLLLHARRGRIRLGSQQFGANLRIYREPVLPLSAAERRLYGDNLGTDVRDANLTPSFPRAAELLRARVARDFDRHVDGVISVDPVALSYLMQATGPIDVGGQRLTADNVVKVLLNETYQRIDDVDKQDAYFAEVAREVFGVLTSGNGEELGWLRELAGAAAQRRVQLWSAHPEEQRAVEPTALSGALLSPAGPDPEVGFYLNNAANGKMEYYLDLGTAFDAGSCSTTGSQTLRARMSLTSHAPEDVSQLSRWVTGPGTYTARGNIKVTLRVYGPRGGRITGLRANGEPLRIVGDDHEGHPVALVTLVIEPGDEITVEATLRTAPGDRADPSFAWTPGIRTTRSQATVRSACG